MKNVKYSKVEPLTAKQEIIHNQFKNYLVKVVGLKAPEHITESLERRVQIFIRENIDASFTCVYDYSDITFVQKILAELKNNTDWMHYNKRHAGTITNSLRHYINFLHYRLDLIILEPVTEPDSYKEGKVSYVHAIGYERNQEARKVCIEHHGCKCAICGFDFEETYGPIGRSFIEVHHLVPIHERKEEYVVNPVKDLIPLCSNCHSMIHRRNPVYSLEELKSILNTKKNL